MKIKLRLRRILDVDKRAISDISKAFVLKRGQVRSLLKKCKLFLYSYAIKTLAHKRGFALGLTLKTKVLQTRKQLSRPVSRLC